VAANSAKPADCERSPVELDRFALTVLTEPNASFISQEANWSLQHGSNGQKTSSVTSGLSV
jgi:hypothetical protein